MAEFTPLGADKFGDVSDPFVLKATLARIEAKVYRAYGGAFNVRDYGAIGDGNTDDTAAIIDAIAGAGAGGVVVWPAGTYSVEPGALEVMDHATWAGAGAGATIIRPRGAGTIVKTTDFDTLTGTDATGGTPDRFRLVGLTLDGDGIAGVTGLQIYGAGYSVQNLVVANCTDGGIFSEWGTGGTQGMEAHWAGWRIENCGGNGLEWNGPHDSLLARGKVWSLDPTMDHAILVAGNATGEYFMGVHTWGRQTVGWRAERPMYCGMCVAEGAFDANVWLVANDCQWIGGQVYGTNGNGGTQPNEVGLRIGDSTVPTGSNGHLIETHAFAFTGTGYPVDYQNSWGNNHVFLSLRAGGSLTWPYKGTPASDDAFQSICGDQPTMSLRVDPKAFQGLVPRSKDGAPAASDLTAGTFQVFKDTTGGGVVLAYNDAGTLKTVGLS